MFNKITQSPIYFGLDIGDQRIKAGLGKITDDGSLELIGAYDDFIDGYQDGSVTDLAELSECIHKTVETLSLKTGDHVKDIILGVGGQIVDCRSCVTTIPLVDHGNKVITEKDLKKLNAQARLLGVQMEEEIVHDIPQCYTVDDVNKALNPLGLLGRKLAVESLMMTVHSNRIKNIIKAVHQAGYELQCLSFSPYVSGPVILQDEDRLEGCVLVDIGSTVTTVMIFKDRILQYMEKIDYGGNYITQDIAKTLELSLDLAEQIKKSYASVHEQSLTDDEEILIKKDSHYFSIKRALVYDAVVPQVKELVRLISASILASGYKEKVNRGVIVTGGTALLPGLPQLIEKDIHLPVQLAKIQIPLKKHIGNPALFSSVIGLIYEEVQKNHKEYQFEGTSGWAKQVAKKVRELYYEYF